MSIDSELRRVGASTREAVAAGLDVGAGLDQLKAISRRRHGLRVAAALASIAGAVVLVAGLVPIGSDRGAPVVDGDRSVRCGEALADTLPIGGAVECAGPRVVLVRGELDYTFRLPRAVPWKLDASGAPWAVDATMDPWADSAGISVLAGVRAAAGGEPGRGLTAAALASWVESRRFLTVGPVVHGMQDGLQAWTVEIRPRPGIGRPGPGRACNGVDTDCHALLIWRQGSSLAEWGVQDGETARLTFIDVPSGGVVALVARADFGAQDSLGVAGDLLRSVDFMFPVD